MKGLAANSVMLISDGSDGLQISDAYLLVTYGKRHKTNDRPNPADTVGE